MIRLMRCNMKRVNVVWVGKIVTRLTVSDTPLSDSHRESCHDLNYTKNF